MSNTPHLLYHGSRFEQPELMPGFLRSGELVKWDETESNEYLYTTTDKNTAYELGFASSLEKEFDIDRFHVHKGVIIIQTQERITDKMLEQLPVFIYTIPFLREDCWHKNSNDHNGLDTEYKTKNTIDNIHSCEQLDVKKWLCNFEVKIGKNFPLMKDGRSKVAVEALQPAYLKW